MDALYAATATPEHPMPWGWLLAALTVAALGYAASCAWWPFAKCGKCEGRGKFTRKDSKVWRLCRRCKGSGSRLRVGRKVWNRFAKVRNASR